MITKFKLFETVNIDEPKVGDYVICSEIADVFYKNKDWYNDKKQLVCRRLAREDIEFWSKNKKDLSDLDLLRKSKKYNI